MKDYGEASCSGASAEPIKDTVWPVLTFAWIRNTYQRKRIRWCRSVITWPGILLIRYKKFSTGSRNQPALCSIRESMPAPLASFEKLYRETAEEFVSRFSQLWKYIQRSVGQYLSFWVELKRFRFQLAKLLFQYFKSKQTQTGLVKKATQGNIHVTTCLSMKMLRSWRKAKRLYVIKNGHNRQCCKTWITKICINMYLCFSQRFGGFNPM